MRSIHRPVVLAEKIALSYAAIRRAAHPDSPGTTDLTPIQAMYASAPTMGIADGVDEVRMATVAGRVLRGYRPHEGYWPTEYIPAKRDKARRRMRPVLDARPDLGPRGREVRRPPVHRGPDGHRRPMLGRLPPLRHQVTFASFESFGRNYRDWAKVKAPGTFMSTVPHTRAVLIVDTCVRSVWLDRIR